jgi:hypothetical protein
MFRCTSESPLAKLPLGKTKERQSHLLSSSPPAETDIWNNRRVPLTIPSISSFHLPFNKEEKGVWAILLAAVGGGGTSVGTVTRRVESV